MPSATHLAIFALAAFAMNAAPGPSNLYVLSRSLAQGAAAGLVSALGLALGNLFHVALAVAGLAALLRYAPTLYDAIRLAGAAYLIYLGIKMLRAPGATVPAAQSTGRRKLRRILFDAALVEMLNPKTALFFLAFLPQFVEPAAGPPAPQLLLLGFIVTLTALPCDCLVALAGARLARFFAGVRSLWPGRVAGSTLIGLGLYTALMRRG